MVQNKFSSDDPYVLPQIMLTAQSRAKSNLNIAIIENDQLQATNLYLQTANLGKNPINPVSGVTFAAQQAIGGAINDGDIRTPPGDRCFLGITKVEVPDGWKYIHDLQIRDAVITFDPDTGDRSQGVVTDKFEHLALSYYLLEFQDGHTTGTTANHRYWIRPGYKAVSALNAVWHWEGSWTLRPIVRQYEILEEVVLYNITVSGFHNYFANGDAVSNRKDDPPGGFLDLPPFI